MENFDDGEKRRGQVGLDRMFDKNRHRFLNRVADKLGEVPPKKCRCRDDSSGREVEVSDHICQENDDQAEKKEYQGEYSIESHIESKNPQNHKERERDSKIEYLDRYPGEWNGHPKHDRRNTYQVDSDIERMLMRCRVAGQHMH